MKTTESCSMLMPEASPPFSISTEQILVRRTGTLGNVREFLASWQSNCSPGRVGVLWHVLLPLVLLHQGPHTPVGILNLLVHAAVPAGDKHRVRKTSPGGSRNPSVSKKEEEKAEEKEVRRRGQPEKCQFSYQGSLSSWC